MEKLKIEFTVKAESDGKTNIIRITSIETQDGRIFDISIQYQAASLHKELITTQTLSKVENTLSKRHQMRKVWITWTQDSENVYIDEEGNMQFGDYYLEEMNDKKDSVNAATSEDPINKLLEKLIETQKQSTNKSVANIAEQFIIEKFSNKNSNATQWMKEFEIVQDEKKIVMLKLFLEKSCIDWYQSMIMKYSIESKWENWKKIFSETYANKGWSPIKYAFSFKYQTGTLLEYATKKERL